MAATTAQSPPLDAEPAQRDRISRALGAAFLSHQVDSLQRSVEDLSFARSGENPTRGMYKGPWGRGGPSSPVSSSWPTAGRAAPPQRGGRGRGSPGRGYANAVTGSRAQTHREREREKQRQRQRDEDKEFDRSLPVPAPNAVVARVLAMPVPAPKQSVEVVDDRDLELEPELEELGEGQRAVPAQAHSSILSWRAEVARDTTQLAAAALESSVHTEVEPDTRTAEPRGPAVPAGINPLSFQRRLADRIVLDASVLVHSLGTVRKWCGDGRREEVIVPLEALNTLDLLKKGGSPLAGSARAASRYLEDQVGLNPRITVQDEEAYVPWEQIPASIPPALVPAPFPAHARAVSVESSPALGGPLGTSTSGLRPVNRADCPEWIKRTLCSAAFEFSTALQQGGRKAVLAVIAPAGDRLRGDEDTARWEARADGREVRAWAQEVGVLLLELGKTPRAERERRSVDSDRERIGSGASAGSRERGGFAGRGRSRRSRAQGIVDKGPVVDVPRVVKVLARGERLDT
ncbi:hypothetical protein CALCODRAFT_488525 [Calocera cornea HHB12733]|uniref:PIN domain-containing protein n=1 Tax=Calocera cornea HHB12733 TaxID=1353952 RepID=A0A165CEG1_9BASI|nr:hypothetical protein CALCODRAFT_488525 [Calocera cornea HHB12733]